MVGVAASRVLEPSSGSVAEPSVWSVVAVGADPAVARARMVAERPVTASRVADPAVARARVVAERSVAASRVADPAVAGTRVVAAVDAGAHRQSPVATP